MSTSKRHGPWSASTRIQHWVVSAALSSLFAAVPIVAAQDPPAPESQGSPPPQIDSYQPFPAAWDQPITIHGSHLVPWQDPSLPAQTQAGGSDSSLVKATELLLPNQRIVSEAPGPSGPSAPVPEGPEPVLKVGAAGKKPGFVIPASDIESWTSSEIRIKKLSGGRAGAYWIAVYQNGKRVSNLNRTLFFPESDPNRTATLAVPDPSDSDEDEEVVITINYPPVEVPSQLSAYVALYQPGIVGAGDEVEMAGWFSVLGNQRLYFGTGNKPIGKIDPKWIKEWSFNKVRFENGFLPSGVYWVAVFEGFDLVSNLQWSLQVTEDPAPPPAGNNPTQIIRGLEKRPPPNAEASSLEPESSSGLKRLPATRGAGPSGKILLAPPPMQRTPRVKTLQPSAEPRKALKTKSQRQPAVHPTTAPPMAPVPEETADKTLRPTEKQPRIQPQRVR